MKIKAQRLSEIKNIISFQKVGSQEELLSLLNEAGFLTTQATLSRDLKFLKVSKVPDPEKGYIYELPNSASLKVVDEDVHEDFPLSGVESIDFSSNMAVIKTKPGFAPSIASVIDSHEPYEILGTIAGDDTILLITREGIAKNYLVDALTMFIPGVKNKVL